MMKAVRASAPGGPEVLSIVEEAIPVLKRGEILLKVNASAVNRADINQRQGNYPPPPGVTDILGLEASGRIHFIGPGCFGNWRQGEHAMALVSGGGYAEYVAVKETHLMPKPNSLSPCEAAGIPEAWLTAFQLLSKVANLQEKETVLIHAGASGVGTAAVQLVSKLYSGTVFATAGSSEKLEFLTNLGAHYVFNYKTDGSFAEWVKAKTEGRGVDVILDCVGASYWNENSECIAMDGRWVVYGLMGGKDISGDILARILRKRIRIQGSTLRNRSDEYKADLIKSFNHKVLPSFPSRLLPIIDRVFPLDQVAEAHRYVEQNLNVGKVILKVLHEEESQQA